MKYKGNKKPSFRAGKGSKHQDRPQPESISFDVESRTKFLSGQEGKAAKRREEFKRVATKDQRRHKHQHQANVCEHTAYRHHPYHHI